MSGLFLVVIVAGWRWPLLGFFIPLCMLLGMGIALFRGRKWCDWYCPRGSFYDTLGRSISPEKEIPRMIKGMPLRIGVLAALMVVMAAQLVKRWPDPAGIGMFFVMLLTITTTLGILLALFLHQRAWCFLCPIGTLSHLIGRSRKLLMIDSGLCTECGLCHKVCPVQVKPSAYKKKGVKAVKDGDCLVCGLCAAACPAKALHPQ